MAILSVHAANNKDQKFVKQKLEKLGCAKDKSVLRMGPLLRTQNSLNKKPVRFRKVDLHCGTNWYVQNIRVNRSQNSLQVLSLNVCWDRPYPRSHTSNWKGWNAHFASNINILEIRKQKGKRKFDEGNTWDLGYANHPTYKINTWFQKKA